MRRKAILSVGWFAVLGLVFSLAPFSFAQSPVKARITGAIDDSSRVTLRGNVRPVFRAENDLGPVQGSFNLENMSLTFKLTEGQQADLAALLAQQQDPTSPNFHHWLTPEQFAERFGLSQNDVDKVAAWLGAQGFTVTQTARSRSWVSFSGTAAQVAAAFQTEIHNFSFNGETYHANATEPSVPSALADVVLGIRGLDNYRLKPRTRVRSVNPSLHPNFTSGQSGNTFVAPGDFAVIYDVNTLYSTGIDGTGQSIAVMGQTALYNGGSDITAFRAAAGLPAKSPTLTLVPGSTNPGVIPGDITEASLDVEWAGAVAKNATIIYVYANPNTGNGVLDSLVYAIDQDVAPVISISYGACEAQWGLANLNILEQLGQQANTQGQTIVAASGDSGAADCDSPSATSATHGLAVDAPASSPYVTGMGGTEFNEGSGTYWEPATGSDVLTSALSYIPEVAWNDTSPSNGLLAGGGGASSCVNATGTFPNVTCISGFAKPSWQTGTGVPNDGVRDVPDLSLNSSPIHDGLLICDQGSCVHGFRDSNNVYLTVAGGTSAAAPTFAGIVALINQQAGSAQGNVNPTLYAMAASTPAAFHDIITGDIIVPCTAGTKDCPSSAPFQIGYSAGVGYDRATGLGSIDAYNLVTAWGSSVTGNLPAPTLSAPANGAAGVSTTPVFGWTAVTGNAGYRIMIATSPSVLPTNPATSTCSSCTLVDTTSTDTTSYTPASALATGIYYWQVQAIEPGGSSGTAAWSTIFSFSTVGATLPAPTLTSPANGATDVSTATSFSWTAVTGNAGYRILVAPTQAALPTDPAVGTCGGCAIGTTTSTGVNSYTLASSPLVASTTYYWEVQALSSSSGLYGTWSSVSSFTTGAADFQMASASSSLTLTAGSSGTRTITMTPVNGFSGDVTLTCDVSSTLTGVTCSLNPTSISAGGSSTLTITASSSASTFPAPPRINRFGGWLVAALALASLLLLLPGLHWRERQFFSGRVGLRQVALGVMLAGLLAASLSCNSSGSSGPPPETGTVTVTGTSTSPSASHSVSITVTVN
jgi:hypothetical protein